MTGIARNWMETAPSPRYSTAVAPRALILVLVLIISLLGGSGRMAGG